MLVSKSASTGFVSIHVEFARAHAADFTDAIAQLERTTGGRIGVSVLDSATGEIRSHHPDERFAMASTFKALLAAAILARVDSGDGQLDIAIARPPDRPPLLIAVYTSALSGTPSAQSTVIAEIGRIIAANLPGSNSPDR